METTLVNADGTPWWEDYRNIVRLTRWMADEGEATTHDIAYAVEKPWKFEGEFRRALEEVE